jgi:uncharacterized membrane protein YhaH (DUF805 family)
MRRIWTWVLTKYWWLWGANVLAALLVFYGFLLGWKHGSITGPNIPACCGILAVVPALLVGSLRLRAARHSQLSVLPLLLIPLPSVVWVGGSLLFGILYLLLFFIASLFGHGRMN